MLCATAPEAARAAAPPEAAEASAAAEARAASAARTEAGRGLLRGAAPLLALVCVGAFASGCASGAYTRPAPAGQPPPPAGSAARGTSAAAVDAIEAAPLRALTVADPAPPTPAPEAAVGTSAAPDPRPRAPQRHHPVPAPAPQAPPVHGSGICDLAERYGTWPTGSSQAANCRAVYG